MVPKTNTASTLILVLNIRILKINPRMMRVSVTGACASFAQVSLVYCILIWPRILNCLIGLEDTGLKPVSCAKIGKKCIRLKSNAENTRPVAAGIKKDVKNIYKICSLNPPFLAFS